MNAPVSVSQSGLDIKAAIAAIHDALAGPMAWQGMAAFAPSARLGTDLGLDSVALLTLMLTLEEAGVDMPEAAFDQAPGLTVQALADFLVGAAPVSSGADPQDIKVHCVVSCFCQAVKDAGGIDHRPLYLGLWDGQVLVDDRMRLSYHGAGVDHDFYCLWAKRLFGLNVTRWYDNGRDKTANLNRMEALIADWRPGQFVMPMLDMFLLPQRDNKFAQDPFPHYALLQPTGDPEIWHMRDPDYRWDGDLPAADLRRAFLRETVAGGYAFDCHGLHGAPAAAVAAMFRTTFQPERFPLIEAVSAILAAHEHQMPRAGLEDALRELPVIAIRKYAYEHGLALFGDIEGPDYDAFEACCERIAELHGGFATVQRRAVAYARGGNASDLAAAQAHLDHLTELERGIKATLADWFSRWHADQHLTENR